jgi:methionyl-tRNA formyltransferase
MRIAVLTTDDPFYLPAFFDRLLEKRGGDVACVYVCAPVYKGETRLSMVRKYARTFGWCNAVRLARRVLRAKVGSALRLGLWSVADACRRHGVASEPCENVNAEAFRRTLEEQGVDVILSVSCPQIFRKKLIELPRLGCLNIHGADLPEYRGVMPSFWMLADGLEQAAVTIFYVNAGVDTGDVAGKRRFPIEPADSLDSFLRRSKREACDLALETLDRIENDGITPEPLVGEGSYFGWPARADYERFRRAGRRLW